MYAGLDVGSRTIKLVIFDSETRDQRLVETSVNPLQRSRELLSGHDIEGLVVTGYGRNLVADSLGAETVSEIKAFATGAHYLYPDCRTIIDIGGQDCKVIQLSAAGQVRKFEMNDRCAAGTGKFLEIMAGTLGVPVSEIGSLALSARKKVNINSLCTVFAESEVISLIAKGEKPAAIALALHEAIATRVYNMVLKVKPQEAVVFAGGAALNSCLGPLLSAKLGVPLTVPTNPQMVGALGAALLAKGKEGTQ